MATPTPNLGFQNFFSATTTAPINASATDIPLDAIPNASEGFLVIEPDSTSNREVIFYNSKTSLKVVCPSAAQGRGQDDTSANSHLQGVTVISAPVAGELEALQSGAALTAGAIVPSKISNPYKFLAYRNGTLTTSGTGLIEFNAELYDSNSNYNTSTFTYTAPVDGFYKFDCAVTYSVSSLGVALNAILYKNGSPYMDGGTWVSTYNNPFSEVAQGNFPLIQLTAGDTIQIRGIPALFVSGATGPYASWFGGYLVTPT